MKILINAGISILLLGSLIATAAVLTRPQTNTKKIRVEKTGLSDQKFLAKLDRVAERMLSKRNQFFFTGTMLLPDPGPEEDRGKKVVFLFCSNGNSYYYKIGDMIFINDSGHITQIDTKAKKIFIHSQTENYTPEIFDVSKIRSAISSGEYQISGSEDGAKETVTLLNENHATCKEYSITYDSASFDVLRFYTRLTDISRPEEDGHGKILEINVSSWRNSEQIEAFLPPLLEKIKQGDYSMIDRAAGTFQVVNL